jgi:hypothetical protein
MLLSPRKMRSHKWGHRSRRPNLVRATSRNMRIDYRWAAGDADRYRRHAAELAALAPDVMVVWGAAIASELQKAGRALDELAADPLHR